MYYKFNVLGLAHENGSAPEAGQKQRTYIFRRSNTRLFMRYKTFNTGSYNLPVPSAFPLELH